ncbi:MAG: MBL fold metallo-hydrolase [Devosiaceae bacterium]|nr:MBL fold metallo-hydrolase [Devosiaceae bacterium]
MSKNKPSTDVSKPQYNLEFEPQTGACIKVASGISRICAPNKGPYTFTGTNTYLLGDQELFIIDPGPDDKKHLKNLLQGIDARKVKAILLTHTHKDHSGLANKLKSITDAPLWFEGRHRLSRPKSHGEINLLHGACDWDLVPDKTLEDKETISIEGVTLEVLATPGHCANHLCLGIKNSDIMFSGDHVMGWNSTLVATPDGSMNDYFNSLKRLEDSNYRTYFPGHGAPIPNLGSAKNGLTYANALRAHRMMRNEQILESIKTGGRSISEIVAKIYPGVGLRIRMAAAMTTQAHIEYLAEQELVIVKNGLLGKKTFSLPD